jgi:acyl dehydratase
MAINPHFILSQDFGIVTETYDARRTVLYALGVGVGVVGTEAERPLLYEPELVALPTMAVVLAADSEWLKDPRTGITFSQILHGEEGLEIYRPLPAAGHVTARSSVQGLYDKGPKGAVLTMKRTLCDIRNGELIATIRETLFLRGDGGFGGSQARQPPPQPTPRRAPDAELNLPTGPNQAALYRLSGDLNPLHIDPAAAKRAGFSRPILHGLCTYGIAGRAIIKALCGGDPQRLTRLDVRFSAPVYPGETLTTQIWQESSERAAFQVKVEERASVVLSNGRADFRPPSNTL